MKLYYTLFAILFFSATAITVTAQNCGNSGFENNNLVGWTGYYGQSGSSGSTIPWLSFTTPPLNWNDSLGYIDSVNFFPEPQHTFRLMKRTDGYDPYVPSVPIVSPFGGNVSIRLGCDVTYGVAAQKLKYTYFVNPDSSNAHPLISFAIIQETPSTYYVNIGEAPTFRFSIKNQNGVSINSFCGIKEYYPNKPGVGYKTISNLYHPERNIAYLDWTLVPVDLTAYAGQNVQFEFMNNQSVCGCYFAYTYLDFYCGDIDLIQTNYCTGDSTFKLSSKATFQSYEWTADSSITVNGQTLLSGQTISTNDTLILPIADTTKTFYLKGFPLQGSTCNIVDSIKPHPIPMSMPISSVILPADTIHFCNNNVPHDTLYGNLGGYWSNGSTDSITTITCEGDYYITNSNSCTTVTSNHVIVKPEHNINTNNLSVLSPNTLVCVGDTVTLQGMHNSTWFNGSVNSTTQVTQPGLYYAVLNHTNYCGADTSYINVQNFYLPMVPIITNQNGTLFSSPAASYQWLYNGSNINLASDSFYVVPQSGLYSVSTVDTNNCSSESSPININLSGVYNLNDSDNLFSLYPIPAKDFVTIKNLEKGASIEIYDIDGRFISSHSCTSNLSVLDISNLNNGCYILKSNSKNHHQSVKRLIVNRH